MTTSNNNHNTLTSLTKNEMHKVVQTVKETVAQMSNFKAGFSSGDLWNIQKMSRTYFSRTRRTLSIY